MEVDTSADRSTLKEACHDMHGIGHYVDEYMQKKCCQRRLWDIVVMCPSPDANTRRLLSVLRTDT